jgi:tetratricopeptide (TPR) repeat protein
MRSGKMRSSSAHGFMMASRTSLAICFLIVSLVWFSPSASAGEQFSANTAVDSKYCGDVNAPPFGSNADVSVRKCEIKNRSYKPRHKGIGFEILDSESKACFVPDEEYEVLDQLIDSAQIRFKALTADSGVSERDALNVSAFISDSLTKKGFVLYIPVETLSDALYRRNGRDGEPRYIFDCDTGTFIFLTIAENLRLPVSMVDSSFPSGATHNYVRWGLGSSGWLNWDLNSRSECTPRTGGFPYADRPMTRTEVLGYARALRAKLWETRQNYEMALTDYRAAMHLYPQSTLAFNNFAWVVATREFPDRRSVIKEAISDATHALAQNRSANYLDTTACTYAFEGEFDKAIRFEGEAVSREPQNESYEQRLRAFKNHQDCTVSASHPAE